WSRLNLKDKRYNNNNNDNNNNDASATSPKDLVQDFMMWNPLSDDNTSKFETFLEQRIKHSFKDGLAPREHQWKTIRSVIKDLVYPKHQSSFNGKRYNYLIQHAAGSGKSITIATLVYFLYKLEVNNKLKFDTIVVMNDRSQLDAQLGDVIIKFLEANGIKSCSRPKSSKQLQYEISHGKNRIVITTMQKFSQLLPTLSKQQQGHSGTPQDALFETFSFKTNSVAIISDEAHRSHGKSTTERLHEFLVGNVKQTSQITYFSFTCTPTPQCLEMFGVSSGGRDKKPFYTYSMEDALKDNLILDVIENFNTLSVNEGKQLLQQQQQSRKLMDEYYQQDSWDNDGDEIIQDKKSIQEKSVYILNHFIKLKKQYDTCSFKSRGMVVCSGRKDLIVYKKTIDALVAQLPMSEQFDTIAAFSPFIYEGKQILESDANVNGKYAHYGSDKHRGIVKAIQDDKIHNRIRLLIVADKLQTGFDEPSLAMMYIDKKMSGANVVQTLSRLSRTTKEKHNTSIVDFVNDEKDVRQIFSVYSGSTTLNDLQGEAYLHQRIQSAANNIKEMFSKERNVKTFAKSILFHKSNNTGTSKQYNDVEYDIQDFLDIYPKLKSSVMVDFASPIPLATVQSIKKELDNLRQQQMDSIKNSNNTNYNIKVRMDTLTDLEAKSSLEHSHSNVDYDADFAATLWADKKSYQSPEKTRESTIQRLKQTSVCIKRLTFKVHHILTHNNVLETTHNSIVITNCVQCTSFPSHCLQQVWYSNSSLWRYSC
ncbi:hypothetical protein SAMD00019534_119310, partial [Acytostelium subglobosum LB1]|uniref:hypothetical protein n=1 Tax=Acytostelium subglobosum LB1 TaxID=1410327 RepID=UPI000644F8FD